MEKQNMNAKFSIYVIVGIAIVASFFTVIAIDSVYLDTLCAEQGGKQDGDDCVIKPTMKIANFRR